MIIHSIDREYVEYLLKEEPKYYYDKAVISFFESSNIVANNITPIDYRGIPKMYFGITLQNIDLDEIEENQLSYKLFFSRVYELAEFVESYKL